MWSKVRGWPEAGMVKRRVSATGAALIAMAPGLAAEDGLLAEIELIGGGGGVRKQDGNVDGAKAVVAIEDADLDFAAAGERNGGAEGLVGFHEQGDEVVGLEVVGEGGSADLEGV